MEGYQQEDQTKDPEEDKKNKKKRRLPSFLKSWLKVSEGAEAGKETEKPKKPFSERTWKVFQNFFGRDNERPQKIEEEEPAEKPQQFLEFAAHTSTEPEVLELSKAEEQKPSAEVPSEGGELIIDHRKDEEESWESSVEEALAYELPPEVEPPIIPLQSQAEIAELYTRDHEESVATSSQPEKIGDVLERRQKQTELELMRQKRRNRRRNRRLKKQVRELNKEAGTASKKQETLKKEQVVLKGQVEQLRQQPNVSQLIARQERERAELRANRGMAGRPESRVVEQPKPTIKTEAVPTPVPEARPRRPEAEPRQEAPRPKETIIQQFEQLPQQDARSEHEFERRHEVKDEAGSPQAAAYLAMASADAAYRAAAAQVGQAAAARSYPTPPAAPPTPQPAFQASDLADSPMYRQAMRNGFLTAVILLAIWLVIYMVR